MAPKYILQHVTTDYPFMSCLLKVNNQSWSWSKTVRKVLRSCAGVHSFKMGDDGLVKVSGTVDPELLLKTLGKAGSKAEVQWLQFGECSNNLFLPASHNTEGYGYYQQAYGYDNRSGHHNSCGYNYNYQQPYNNRRAYHDSCGYKYDYQHACNHGHDHYSYDQLPEDIGCCRLM